MADLYITLPRDFDELLIAYRLKVLGTTEPIKGELTYDKDAAQLRLGRHSLQVPLSTNQSVICEALFEREHGEWLKDIDVRPHYLKASETSLYDAVRALNRLVYDAWKIDELFQYEKLRVRIRKEALTQAHSG